MRSKLGGELMRAVSRFAIVGVVGGMTAACSTDRFAAGNAFTNPFASGGPEPVQTGSVRPETPPPAAMPRSSIEAQPLAPIRPVQTPPQTYSTPNTPAASAPSHPRTASGTAGWSTTGGTTVIVGPGETITTLTSRYGVPAEAILSANGIKATEVAAGRRVIIPVYSARGEAAPARRAEAPAAPVRYNTPAEPARVVASQKIEVKKQAPRTLAEAAPAKSQLRPGAKPAVVVEKAPVKVAEKAAAPAPARAPVRVVETKPAPQKVAAAPAPAPKLAAKPEPKKPEPKKVEAKVAKLEPKPAEKEIILPAKKVAAKAEPKAAAPVPAPKEAPQKVAAVKLAEPAKVPVKEPETTASISPAPAPAATSGGSDFRWPARGRVISGFGGGSSNEGINIAVPEGTPVKAAGDGVVAYAGSEVKGYGNLVLIRHDNGYVSAYANNGQIDVKRGQRVTRGHTIAKSGQTGNVTSPQLHFEIRKGSTPVDPMKYLASAE